MNIRCLGWLESVAATGPLRHAGEPENDRLTGKRELHNRSGSYACELAAKRNCGPAWRDIVMRARQFDIDENELEGLAIRVEKRNASFKARSGARSVARN